MTITFSQIATVFILIGIIFIFIYIYTKTQNKTLRACYTVLVLLGMGLLAVVASSVIGEAFFKYALNYNVTASNSITSSDAMFAILTAMVGTVFVYMFSERR